MGWCCGETVRLIGSRIGRFAGCAGRTLYPVASLQATKGSTVDTASQPAEVRRRTVSVEEAGRILGLGRTAAYAAARRGDIPTIAIGRRLIVPIDRLERMLSGDNA
jgi:hypothetical protein